MSGLTQSDLDSLQHQFELYDEGKLHALEKIMSEFSSAPPKYGDPDEEITITTIYESDREPQKEPDVAEPEPEPVKSRRTREPVKNKEQPTKAKEQPTKAKEQPTIIEREQPITAREQPTTAREQPTTAREQPTTAKPQPVEPRRKDKDDLVRKDKDDLVWERYEPLTNNKKQELATLTREWLRLGDTLTQMRRVEREIRAEYKEIDNRLQGNIDRFGLKEIKKGKHNLIPKIKPGRKKAFSNKGLQEDIKEFASIVDFTSFDDPDDFSTHLYGYLDNKRSRARSKVFLDRKQL